MIRRIAVIMTAIFVWLLAFLVLSWRPAIGLVQRQNLTHFSTESIAKGEVLSAIGHCQSCHTRPGGQMFAGGYGVNTPFGIVYGSNITPDEKTGIGNWSLDAFRRAMREGVARDGSHLFPAFPYYAYTKLSDDDIRVLYAYLMTRPPVSATVPANTLPFPLRIRALQEGWKLLFFTRGRYRPDRSKSEEWNRGAYLAEALSDCSGCHTPRNWLGAEETGRAYTGAVIDGWIAPALNEVNPSPIPWKQDELFTYLRTGVAPLHGATGATMTPVIREGLALRVVPDSDVRAIAVYFADMDHAGTRTQHRTAVKRNALATSSYGSAREFEPDAELYAAACISCHYNSGTDILASRPELALSSTLSSPEPTNFIQVVLNGVGDRDGAQGLVMPAYASSLTDGEIASLAAYLRRTRTKYPAWSNLEEQVSIVRRQSEVSHGS